MGWMSCWSGPLPTPAIAMLTRSAPVPISRRRHPRPARPATTTTASKLFGRDGYKLSDEDREPDRECLEKGPGRRAPPRRIARPEPSGSTTPAAATSNSSKQALRAPGFGSTASRVVVGCRAWRPYKVAPTRVVGGRRQGVVSDRRRARWAQHQPRLRRACRPQRSMQAEVKPAAPISASRSTVTPTASSSPTSAATSFRPATS